LAEALVEACELAGEFLCGTVAGLNEKQDNLKRLPVFASNMPGDASVYNFIHYG